jgi:protein-disulfide isomerase
MEMLMRARGAQSARRVRGNAALVCALTGLSLGLASCTEKDSAAATPPRTPRAEASAGAKSDGIPQVLATIGDQEVTLADVRARVGDQLDQMENQYRHEQYKIIDKALQALLNERVIVDEAKKQGKTTEELITAAVGGSLEPTEVEVTTWYSENRNRVGNRTLEQVRPQIVDYLRKDKRNQGIEKLNARLNQERKVAVRLEPFRVSLNNDGAPARGPSGSTVTLTEFSDFQCPYCKGFFPVLKQVEEKYGDRIRIVYRQYPIPSLHPFAFKAAEASLCANDQGKFWELHDLMFQEQEQLAVKDLKAKATRLGLDQKKFDSCLDTGRYTERVQEDMKEGSRVGVSGTPALFVNGVEIDGGSVPFEVVARALDKELAGAKK